MFLIHLFVYAGFYCIAQLCTKKAPFSNTTPKRPKMAIFLANIITHVPTNCLKNQLISCHRDLLIGRFVVTFHHEASLHSRRLRKIGRAVLGNAEGARRTLEARSARVSLFLHRAP